MTHVLRVVAKPDDDGATPDADRWERLVPDQPAPDWPWDVDQVTYSVAAAPNHLADRLDLPGALAESAAARHLHGWDICPTVSGAALVHVCRPCTPAGEIAVLVSKALGKPIVLSDLDHRTSPVGVSFGLFSLADCLVCESEEEAGRYPDHPWVHIVDPGTEKVRAALLGIYQTLLDREEPPG